MSQSDGSPTTPWQASVNPHASGNDAFPWNVTVHGGLASNRYQRTLVDRQQLGREPPLLLFKSGNTRRNMNVTEIWIIFLPE